MKRSSRTSYKLRDFDTSKTISFKKPKLRSKKPAASKASSKKTAAPKKTTASKNAKKMRVIGITGTLGAGKGAVVDYLVEKCGFVHLSVRFYLTEVIKQRGLPLNRDTMTAVANELRAANSPSYIAEQLLVKAHAGKVDAIIESIRTAGEAKALSAAGNFTLLAVDAPAKLRFTRIKGRGSATDDVDFEKFLADEAREMNNKEPHMQNLKAVMDMADVKINNTGTMDELHAKISKLFE